MLRRLTTIACFLVILAVTAPCFAQATVESGCDLRGYSPSVRPDTLGVPTEVGVGLMLIDLSAISDVSQSITLDALVTLEWTDPRLHSAAGCRYDIAAIWTPEIHLLNSATVQLRQSPQILIKADGRVVFTARYTATVASTANIVEFPFDERDIVLRLGSLHYDKDELVLRVIEPWTGRAAELTVPDWAIGEPSVAVSELNLPRVDRTLTVFEFQVSAARLADYYVFKFVFPLCLIVMMSWSVFWVNPQNLSPQLQLAGTSMLTLIAYQFTVNELLPRVGYLTSMDQYVQASSLLVFLALVEALITGRLASTGRVAQAETLDRVSRWLFPVTYVTIIFVTLW
jgi:gamma-aminobutyric acid receptor subunit beta